MTVQKEMGKWFNLPAIQSTEAYRVYVCNLGNRFEFMFIKVTCLYLRNFKPIGTMNLIVSLAVDWPVFKEFLKIKDKKNCDLIWISSFFHSKMVYGK